LSIASPSSKTRGELGAWNWPKPSSLSYTVEEPDYLPWAVVAKMNITKLEEII
jgi:hypothetical protein